VVWGWYRDRHSRVPVCGGPVDLEHDGAFLMAAQTTASDARAAIRRKIKRLMIEPNWCWAARDVLTTLDKWIVKQDKRKSD
jgi:hypothetical protein